jgi:hypothetical protein
VAKLAPFQATGFLVMLDLTQILSYAIASGIAAAIRWRSCLLKLSGIRAGIHSEYLFPLICGD